MPLTDEEVIRIFDDLPSDYSSDDSGASSGDNPICVSYYRIY